MRMKKRQLWDFCSGELFFKRSRNLNGSRSSSSREVRTELARWEVHGSRFGVFSRCRVKAKGGDAGRWVAWIYFERRTGRVTDSSHDPFLSGPEWVWKRSYQCDLMGVRNLDTQSERFLCQIRTCAKGTTFARLEVYAWVQPGESTG